MAGEVGGGGRGQVSRIESLGRAVTPEDVWNAAVRAGVDPARAQFFLTTPLCTTRSTACATDDRSRSAVRGKQSECAYTSHHFTAWASPSRGFRVGMNSWPT
jgi:hypothetical protein